MVECRIPDVLSCDADGLVELRRARTLILLGCLVDGAKHGLVTTVLSVATVLTQAVVVDVPLLFVVRRDVRIDRRRKRLQAVEHELGPGAARVPLDTPQDFRQGEADGHVAVLKQVALIAARRHLEVLPPHDARARGEGLLCKGAGDRLGLNNQLPDLLGRGDGRLEERCRTCDEVRQLLHIAGPTAGRLVGNRPHDERRGDDLVIKEEQVVLEGDATPEAEVARDEERETLEIMLGVEATDATADLLFALTHAGQLDDTAIGRRHADLLEEAVEDDDGRTNGDGELGDLLVALLLPLARCKDADAGLLVAVRLRLHYHLHEGRRRLRPLRVVLDLGLLHAEVHGKGRVLQR